MADRATPAGRFDTEPGTNLEGDAVVWFDYDAGLAIHRLRPNAVEHACSRRLSPAHPRAHRVTAGCVVVPVIFYESVVMRWLGHGHAVLYVLPNGSRSARSSPASTASSDARRVRAFPTPRGACGR
jgi:hypothetical protein